MPVVNIEKGFVVIAKPFLCCEYFSGYEQPSLISHLQTSMPHSIIKPKLSFAQAKASLHNQYINPAQLAS